MFISKIAVVLLIVISSNHLHYGHGAMQLATRSHVIDKGILFANRHSFNEGNLVYAICDSTSQLTTNCKVVQEKYPYKEIARSCLVTLDNNHNNGFLTVVVAALGKDKAVLIWKYKHDHSTIVTVGIINLETCQMNRVEIPNSALSVLLELYFITKFVSYNDDSFDIFYNDPRSQAADAPLYRMQIDGIGRIKSKPKIVNVERGRYLFVSPVATGSPSKGHVYERKNLMDLSATPKYYLWLAKPDGTRKHLADYNGFPRSDVSAGNNFIGLCYKPDLYSDITCTQLDANGSVIFTTTLTDTSHNIESLTSYNLAEGGMLVMYGGERGDQQESYNKETVFQVVRIDPDGIKIGSLRALEVEIPTGKMRVSYIYKNISKGYCATLLVTDVSSDILLKKEMPLDLTIFANCFSEYDFSVWN